VLIKLLESLLQTAQQFGTSTFNTVVR